MEFVYSIPLLGSVKIELSEYPEMLYHILEKKGEISRLQKLAHLGVLQSVFPGMQHTRWDYTVTMLYLIQRLGESKLEGLSTAKKVKGLRLSGRDEMQLLALAANIGHLPGTFAIEKGIMRYLVTRIDVARKLCKPVNISEGKFRKIDYLNLNKLFLLAKLQSWLDGGIEINKDEKEIVEVVKILSSEIFLSEPETEHKERVRGYFNFIRRVSYQLLDCLYVNLPIRIDYREFIDQLSKPVMNKEEMRAIRELTDCYTCIVYKQIYHSDKACNALAVWADRVFEELVQQNDTLEMVRKWLKSSELSDIVQNPSRDLKRVFSCTLPRKFGVDFLTESFRDSQVDKLEMEVTELLESKKVLILYIPGLKDPISEDFSPSELLFHVYSNKSNGTDKFECWRAIALILVWAYRKFKDSWGVGLIAKAAMESVLQTLAPNHCGTVVTLAPDEFFEDEGSNLLVSEDKVRIFHVRQSSECKEALRIFRRKEAVTWGAALKEQFHECEFLKEMIKRKWPKPRRGLAQYLIMLPGRIKFTDQSTRRDICEFDGALLTIEKRKQISKMALFLLEAKSGKRNSKFAGKKYLRKDLDKLGIGRLSKVRRIKKDAYVEITLLPAP